jgi:iron complex transport system substrate-binding protein
VDDAGRTVTLAAPARRIVSLAPHATELVYASGAGAALVGVSEYSTYPPEAGKLPSVGGVSALDLERVIALKPDLVVVWGSGNSATQIARLRQIGVPVFESEPRSFDMVATSLERLAILGGTDVIGRKAASAFRNRLSTIEKTYRHRPTVSVFYQIWRTPLMTLNGDHLVSSGLQLCGGRNIFADLPQLAPTVGIEAVVKADPDTIIASSGAKDDALHHWRRFDGMRAVKRGNLYTVNGELMNRAAPRVLDGVEALCKVLEKARIGK